MYAEKLMLETDADGLLKSMPVLPPNCQVEAIFIVLNESILPPVSYTHLDVYKRQRY